MSDKHQPENAGAKPPERGMPVAGRQPDPAAQPVRAGDEPTVVTTPSVPGPATQPVGAGDEATRRLSVPAGPAVDDEPTVERPERPELDAETQRLRPPAVVPGKEKAPVTRPVPAASCWAAPSSDTRTGAPCDSTSTRISPG